MGYYSTYEITVEPEMTPEMEQALKDRIGYGLTFSTRTSNRGQTKTRVGELMGKWYDREEDMEPISQQFPDALFRVYAVGEDGGSWIDFFKNGEHENLNVNAEARKMMPKELV